MGNYVFTFETDETTAVSHGDITFTLRGTYETGNYVDGPAYVVIPSGSTIITAISPAETILNDRMINGVMKNPQASSKQAYDERRGYDNLLNDPLDPPLPTILSGGGYYEPTLKADLPLSVTANDVVVKAKANLDPAITNTSTTSHRRGLVSQYGALFIVTSTPAAGTFAPAATGWSGRSSLTDYSIDISTFVAGLPSYATTGHDKPTYAEIIARIGKFNPYFAMSQLGHRFFLTESFGKDADNYGRYAGANLHAAMLALISDGYSTPEKEEIAKWLFSHGIQWFDPHDGGSIPYDPDGALYQFHFGPIAMALSQTGRTAKYSQLLSVQGGNFKEAIQVTPTLAADLATPHSDLNKPWVNRQRNLDSVDSATLMSMETYRSGNSGDDTKFTFRGFTVTNGTATATVGDTFAPNGGVGTGDDDDIPSGVDGQYYFNVDDTTGFSANDTIWFEAPITAIEGDFDWSIRGYDQISQYAGHEGRTGEYREINEWSGLVLALRGMSIWDSSWDAIQGLVTSNNRDNWPLPTFNFSSSHGVAYGTLDNAKFWDSDYWTDHAATILDIAGPVISGVTATPGDGEIIVEWSTSETGRARVLAFPNGTTATLPAWLIRGKDDSETDAVSDSGIITVSGTGAQANVALTGLTNGTTYDVFIVALDEWSNPTTTNVQDVIPIELIPPSANGITVGAQEPDGDIPVEILDLSENATAYFSVTSTDQSLATPAAVVTAGGGGAGLTDQVDFGSFSATVNGGPYTPPLTNGLDGNYYMQIVFEDASTNLSPVYADGPFAIDTTVGDYTIANSSEWDAVFANSDATLSGKTIAITGDIPEKTLTSRTFSAAPILSCSGSGKMERLVLAGVVNIDLDGMVFEQDLSVDNDGSPAYDLLHLSGTCSGVVVQNSTFDGNPAASDGSQRTEAQLDQRMSGIGNSGSTTGALTVSGCTFIRMYDAIVYNAAPLTVTGCHFEQIYIDAMTGVVNSLAGTGTGWVIQDNTATIFEGLNKRRYTVSSVTGGNPVAGEVFTSGDKVLEIVDYDAANFYVFAIYNTSDPASVSDVFTSGGKSFTVDVIASAAVYDGKHGDFCQPIKNSGSGNVPLTFDRNHVYRSIDYDTTAICQEQNVQGLLAQTNGGTIVWSPLQVHANIIAGGQSIGIKIDNAANGSIMHNQVVWQERQGATRSRHELSNIASSVVVTKNVGDETISTSSWYSDLGGNSFVNTGNLYLDGDDGSQDIAMVAPTTYPQTLARLAPVAGQAIDNAGAGPLTTSGTFRTVTVPTAATLTSPSGTQTGQTTANISVSTDDGTGTIYAGVYPTASTPSEADIIAGTGATYSSSSASPGTGTEAFSATGLTASTAYKAHFVQIVGATSSGAVTSAEFTTASAAATNPALVGSRVDGESSSSSTATLSSYAAGAGSNRLIVIFSALWDNARIAEKITCTYNGSTVSPTILETSAATNPYEVAAMFIVPEADIVASADIIVTARTPADVAQTVNNLSVQAITIEDAAQSGFDTGSIGSGEASTTPPDVSLSVTNDASLVIGFSHSALNYSPADFDAGVTQIGTPYIFGSTATNIIGQADADTSTVSIEPNYPSSRAITIGLGIPPVTFFTQGATGPYFVDPSNVPAATSSVRYRIKFRIPNTVAATTGSLARIESQGFDVELWGDRILNLEKIEDSAGTALEVNANLTVLSEDTWYELDITADHSADEYYWSLNGGSVTTTAYDAASTGTFSTAREVSFASNSSGINLLPEGVEIEFYEVYFNGVLHKRIAGNAATVNADAWKAGGDAT